MSKEVFALDIGTRKVMGIIANREAGCLNIIDMEVLEHSARPMVDGQIHSIEEVARSVKLVKERLELRFNKKLEQVGVAVAGRNLVTYKCKVEKEFEVEQEITQGMVRDLELEAVDKIISDSRTTLAQFYCVGYSPVYYELDKQRITNLVGHYARSMLCEVIATFLPRVVLDSMFAVLKKVKLIATNITLEPICAINAIIPNEMRKLNIILVDIGAGTSDIAVTKDGVVFAYGMVPEAGDEITERICEILLVDFSTAERIKRLLLAKNEIEYEDIWSRPRRIDALSLRDILSPSVKKLAEAIARKGTELNSGVPQAVVCVGGGSLTYNLVSELALAFCIPVEKIGIRLPTSIKNIKNLERGLTGPEAITPLGIAQMTLNAQGLNFIDVEVNNRRVKILDFYQKKDVMGALTLSGMLADNKLYPRPGLALSVMVNGELKMIKGTLGQPAEILLNGKPVSSLGDKIKDQDKISFSGAIDGFLAQARIKDLVSLKELEVTFNNEVMQVSSTITMDGQEVDLDVFVCDRAVIENINPQARDILLLKGIKLENFSQRQVLVNINGLPKIVTQKNFILLINGHPADLNSDICHNDKIEFSQDATLFYRICDVVDAPE
ncbi:MAG: rod shape-determining protein, partial [Candidatus Omnitrophica bacterium]|nr:rod shape-determining protein [Candidatus Omnitrophota bacterium]